MTSLACWDYKISVIQSKTEIKLLLSYNSRQQVVIDVKPNTYTHF